MDSPRLNISLTQERGGPFSKYASRTPKKSVTVDFLGLCNSRSFSSQLPPPTPDPVEAEPPNGQTPASLPVLSKRQLLKKAVKDYGSTVIVFHVGISLVSLGGFYAGVSSGLDMVSMVSHIPYIGSKIASSDFGTGASTFVVAYAVHKCFAPVRISITLTSTPFIVNFLRRKGVLK